MTYEKFKRDFIEKLTEKTKEMDIIFHFQKFVKNNDIECEGFSFKSEKMNLRLNPFFYLDDYFELYKEGSSIDELVNEIVEKWQCAVNDLGSASNTFVEKFLDFQRAKDHIYCALLNKQRNKERGKTIPHKDFLDLIQACYYEVNDYGVIWINLETLKAWGISKEELFRIALENTEKQQSYTFSTMLDILKELCGETFETENFSLLPMYILSNKNRNLGSGTILYPGLLSKISKDLNADLWLIPSSIHEWIIVPKTKEMNYDQLKTMIQDVNTDAVNERDILSDHPYLYERKSDKISF